MRKLYSYLPFSFRLNARKILKFFLYKLRFLKLKTAIHTNKEVKIILGAALTSQKGWFSSNEEWLDITNPIHWQRLFSKRRNLSNAVAEHVFEHLTEREMEKALFLIHKYLKKKGTLRIAVPDGNHPDSDYRKNTGIKGIGPDASDHKQFIKYEFIKEVLERKGYSCNLIEGFLFDGRLIQNKINNDFGYINRSRSNKKSMHQKDLYFKDENTSLIIDAIKL